MIWDSIQPLKTKHHFAGHTNVSRWGTIDDNAQAPKSLADRTVTYLYEFLLRMHIKHLHG